MLDALTGRCLGAEVGRTETWPLMILAVHTCPTFVMMLEALCPVPRTALWFSLMGWLLCVVVHLLRAGFQQDHTQIY